jgi:hypothetical protein
MLTQIEDEFLEWLGGIDPTGMQNWVVFEEYEAARKMVYVRRHPDFDLVLIRLLEQHLQRHVDKGLKVATMRMHGYDYE